MLTLFDLKATKKPTNLTINSDLLRVAKELNINISAVLEQALSEQVKKQKTDEWLKENEEMISIFNKDVLENGCFSDGLRSF